MKGSKLQRCVESALRFSLVVKSSNRSDDPLPHVPPGLLVQGVRHLSVSNLPMFSATHLPSVLCWKVSLNNEGGAGGVGAGAELLHTLVSLDEGGVSGAQPVAKDAFVKEPGRLSFLFFNEEKHDGNRSCRAKNPVSLPLFPPSTVSSSPPHHHSPVQLFVIVQRRLLCDSE